MKLHSFLFAIVAVVTLTTCSIGRIQQDLPERRSAQWQRMQDGRAYSEFLRGRYAALTNDPHRAATFYAAAAKSEPLDKDLLERAVFTSLIAADVQTAIQTARNAPAEVLEDTALPKLVLAVDALAEDRSRDAARLLEQGVRSRFNNLIASSLRAWSMYDAEGLDAGLAGLDQTTDRSSLIGGLSGVTRGMIQLHAGQDDTALKTFETMWKDGLRLASTTELLAKLLVKSGQHEEAIEILTLFGEQVGQNAAIEATRHALLAGETPEIGEFTIQHGSAVSVYTAAAALAAQTDSDLAGVYFALALFLDNDLHVARTLWANSLDDADRRENAIEMLQEVPESSLFYSTARGQLAWALRREGRNEEALQTASDALGISADRNLKIQLGDLFRSLGELEQAEIIFTEIIDRDVAEGTQDWRLFYARGAIREQRDMWPEGEADLLVALDLAPNQPSLLNYLGYSWIDRGQRLDQSLEMIRTAVALRPGAGFIVDSLGWAHFRLGNYEEAVKHLERAVELSPSEAALNDHLGDAYWHVGRRIEARFQWARALKIAPDGEDVHLIQTKLDNGFQPKQADDKLGTQNPSVQPTP